MTAYQWLGAAMLAAVYVVITIASPLISGFIAFVVLAAVAVLLLTGAIP